MTKVYRYTETNRLDEPHTYMYTPFEGEALLKAFNNARMTSIRKLSATHSSARTTGIDVYNQAASFLENSFDSISVGAGDRFRQILSFNSQRSGQAADYSIDNNKVERLSRQLPKYDVTEAVSTLDLLNSLVAAQLTGVPDRGVKEWIDRLVQRFEVTKKLYVTYLPGFRRGEGTNSAVKLYWLFALALSMYYVTSGQVKYLSTLLKVCDLLCSLPEEQHEGQLSSELMQTILATELVSIELLVEKRGINVAFA